MTSFNSSGVLLSALEQGGVDLLAASDGAIGLRRGADRITSVARHEAGHVVADYFCGLSIERVTIDREITAPGTAGAVWSTPDDLTCKPLKEFSDITLDELTRPPRAILEGQPLSQATCVLLYAKMIALLAGKEAAPDQPAANSSGDIRKAAFYSNCIAGTPKAALALIDRARADAKRILIARKHQVEVVAVALIARGTLDGSEIADILAGVPPAQMAERQRRKDWAAMTERAASFGKTLERISL
jgi:hypothetical protein